MAQTSNPLFLPAGDLRHTVDILDKSVTVNESGAAVVWQSVATLRAKVEPVRAMEVLRSGQDVSQTYITVTLRFHSLIKASMRLRTQNGTYIIQGVENVLNRDRVLKLMCLQVGDTE